MSSTGIIPKTRPQAEILEDLQACKFRLEHDNLSQSCRIKLKARRVKLAEELRVAEKADKARLVYKKRRAHDTMANTRKGTNLWQKVSGEKADGQETRAERTFRYDMPHDEHNRQNYRDINRANLAHALEGHMSLEKRANGEASMLDTSYENLHKKQQRRDTANTAKQARQAHKAELAAKGQKPVKNSKPRLAPLLKGAADVGVIKDTTTNNFALGLGGKPAKAWQIGAQG